MCEKYYMKMVFIKQYEQRLKDTFQQKCRSEIANSNRCSLYNHLHREFTMANYLNKVHIRTNRRAKTKHSSSFD